AASGDRRVHGGSPALEHDPEKWIPVFGKNHAQTWRQGSTYGRTRVSGCGPSGTRCQAAPSPSANRHVWLRAFLSTSSPRSICQAVGAKRVTTASQPGLSLSAK